jgi:hypothetical protein
MSLHMLLRKLKSMKRTIHHFYLKCMRLNGVWNISHLRGKQFLLFTDHKPLEKLGKVHTKTLYRIQEAMLQYDFEIHYRKGEEMPADYMSRNILSINDDLDNIGLQQEKDEQLSTIISFLRTGKLPNNKEGKILITKYANRCFLEDNLLWIRFFDPIFDLYTQSNGPQTMRSIPPILVWRT